ncbi:MAG: hypothetical protein GY747_07670 [Planctomycetes bacterium]|nr:hypothetical protein [Planctomycetota bacterium]MCP4772119.1 hypothetical protein [Planctomycetota bacterium]MCP4862214.1 hypothetical protein [Planctomycetota bacterium]
MYKALLICALLATSACSSSPNAQGSQAKVVVSPVVDWKQLNDQALPEAERLAQTDAGSWILIAGGKVLGPWVDFQDAWARASVVPAEQDHAYLYRLGIDDAEPVFYLSPFLDNDPHWVQLGRRCWGEWGLTIAAANNVWYRNGKSVTWGDMEARIHLFTPAEHSESQVRAVASMMFEADLTLRPSDAAILGAGRFTAPGYAYLFDESNPCKKVLVLVRVPELGIDVPAMAFILPEFSERL